MRGSGTLVAVVAAAALAAPAIVGAAADGPRYQIVKTENGTLWRLNTETGEIAMCRAEGARMVCASSGEQIERSTQSVADLEAAAAREREAQKLERLDMMNRLVDIFERLIAIVSRHEAAMSGGTADLPDAPKTQ